MSGKVRAEKINDLFPEKIKKNSKTKIQCPIRIPEIPALSTIIQGIRMFHGRNEMYEVLLSIYQSEKRSLTRDGARRIISQWGNGNPTGRNNYPVQRRYAVATLDPLARFLHRFEISQTDDRMLSITEELKDFGFQYPPRDGACIDT